MPGRTDSRARLLLLLAVVTALSGGLMLRLAYWQVAEHPALAAMANQDTSVRKELPAARGTIYDRTGTVVLAQTINRYRVVASPADLTATEKAADATALIDYLGLGGDTAAALRRALSGNASYVVLASNVDASVGTDISRAIGLGGLPGISLETQPVRVYPQAGGAPGTSLAAQVLGFVNGEGKGQYGVEQAYNSMLSGRPQVVLQDPSVFGPAGTQVLDAGAPGADIRLTIDASLQLAVEQEVFSAWVADRAKSVSAVVMDPRTGELLAEASYPSYDANEYQQVASTNASRFMDPIISEVYEPGSVFKMLLASAALGNRTATLDTKIDDYGVYRLPDGTTVADADRTARGWMHFQDIVAWSRNVGVTQAALHLGKDLASSSKVLFDTWREYGIGQKTGVDLAGELPGIVNDPTQQAWRPIDLANGSFGQGVAATQLQVTRAYAAMVNGGALVTPHVLATGPGAVQPAAAHQIIDPQLSSTLTGLMTHVVTTVGPYARGTLIPGYAVGGKTGTAQIWDPTLNDGKGGWKANIFNYSFYGWVGQRSPQVVIGIVIREGTPLYVRQGALPMPEESYQLFRRVATAATTSLAIPRDPNPPVLPKPYDAPPRA